ncbi:hypothetical protein NPIL_703501 [Nephila pilipes]|uniref:Uncharacterized protein n=1 Tax=Nephila pilipes TaxID=299642 RepID=A0A8X6MV34_NEPPI|nr:hypothetical protein NPIL_703501 [Nephila pilipes]
MLLSSHPTHSPFFLGPLSIIVLLCHGSGAPAQWTGVVMPTHVVHQTMYVDHMSTHGGFRPHHRLQADWTLFGRLEDGRRPVVGVHRIHQRLNQRHPPIEGLGAVFAPSLQEQVVQFDDAVLFPNEIQVGLVPLIGHLFRILLIKLTEFTISTLTFSLILGTCEESCVGCSCFKCWPSRSWERCVVFPCDYPNRPQKTHPGPSGCGVQHCSMENVSVGFQFAQGHITRGMPLPVEKLWWRVLKISRLEPVMPRSALSPVASWFKKKDPEFVNKDLPCQRRLGTTRTWCTSLQRMQPRGVTRLFPCHPETIPTLPDPVETLPEPSPSEKIPTPLETVPSPPEPILLETGDACFSPCHRKDLWSTSEIPTRL